MLHSWATSTQVAESRTFIGVAALRNRVIPEGDTWSMSFDVMEEGTPCDYCGQPVGFMDDDWAVCPTCRAEFINMDFEGGDRESESPLEY
jgi:hypothetical protein